MRKSAKLIKLFIFLFCICSIFTIPNLFAQELPKQMEVATDQTSESFDSQSDVTIRITVNDDLTYMEVLASPEQLADTYAAAFEMLDVVGANQITTAYLENGYALSDVAQILKNADFSLENTFQGMRIAVGEESLDEVIGALLNAEFNSRDVFKLAINYVKSTNTEMTDTEIIESILGTEVDSDYLKGLMQEIFIEKISSVSDSVRSDLVVSMIDVGFTLNEITSALSESGFNVDQVAQIYSLASVDIGLTYDLLMDFEGTESDVAQALIASDYSKSEVFVCIVDKLIGTNSSEQIVGICMGLISKDGPTDEQLNNSITLGGVLSSEQISNTEISSAMLLNGFSLENTAAVLNSMGIEVESSFSALLGANNGQAVEGVALALISNGFDVQTVFSLSTVELKSQSVGLDQIVVLLIGAIDNPEASLTNDQKSNSLLLLDVLINDNDSLADIGSAFAANDFSLLNIAKVFKSYSLDEQSSYTALSSVADNSYAEAAIAMVDAAFNIDTVIDMAVSDLQVAEYSTADIMSMLIEVVVEDKLPSTRQINVATSLTKILIEQETDLLEIGTNMINIGFDSGNTAKVLKRSKVDIADAFSVMLSLNTEGFNALCADLRSARYKASDIFANAVTTLESQGQDTATIINTLITEVEADKSAVGLTLTNARDLTNYLISEGSEISEIYDGLSSVNFSLTDIAKVMQRTTVEMETVFADLLAMDGDQNIGNICEALITASYNKTDVFQFAVSQLKELGTSTAAIVNNLIGTVASEENLSTFQNRSSQDLFQILLDDGADLGDICTGFINSNFSLVDISDMTKDANIEILTAYNTILNAGEGQSQIEVIDAMNETGYSMANLYQAIVPQLQNENYSTQQIMSYLISSIPSEGMTEAQLVDVHTLVYVLSETNVSIEDICSAMRGAGFAIGDTAKVIYRKVGDEAKAYSLLTTNYSDSLNTSAIGMINAGYSIGVVLNLAVPAYEQQNVEMAEIISLIISTSPVDLQVELSEKLMNIFTDKGDSVSSISQALFDTGIDISSIAGILSSINTSIDDAYSVLTSITPSQDIISVAFAMIDSAFDSQSVVNLVVDSLITSGNNSTQIISMFLGTVDSKIGLTDTSEDCAVALIVKLNDGGTSLEDISSGLNATGLTIEQILPLMLSAEISIENTFNAMLSFDEGQEPVELAKTMILNSYNSGEVLAALVDYLMVEDPQNNVNTLVSAIIGDIDSEEGLTTLQQGYASVLVGVLIEKDNSLESVATGLLNHGIDLNKTAVILKQSNLETEETYTALIAAYTPQENEVSSREVTGEMISAGFDSFSLYSFTLEKLDEQGINDESELVSILIGPVNSENSAQLSNAGKLSIVINYNKAKLTAQNNMESFISLFGQGFNITEISQMLDEGGVTQAEVDVTLADNLNEIVNELCKSGMNASTVVSQLITQSNKSELIRPLAEQLKRNDFSTSQVRCAFYSMSGGMYASDWTIINEGIHDANDYSLETTTEAETMTEMISSGQTLTEISQHFAEQGYQMSYVAKLFKTLDQSSDDIFTALEETKTAYSSELLVNDTAASIAILPHYEHKQVFTSAAYYYKQIGVSSEEIILKLMSSEVNLDSTSIVADTMIDEYYKGKAAIESESFIMLLDKGYSVTWIKDVLLENDFSSESIEGLIQDGNNFQEIYQGLRSEGWSATTIATRFDIENNPGEYTVLLAENIINDDVEEAEVNSILLELNGDSLLIQQGIDRAAG